MAFITGLMLFDCPASALNMSNDSPDEAGRGEMATAVKFIRSKQGRFPYVSAQAFRYWLRTTLENSPELKEKWKAAPVFREQKVAYSDGNPIRYWDDDLFGYMRAPSKKADAVKKREDDKTRKNETPTSTEITRVSPFKVSTLVAISPIPITYDFGTMSRHEGDPVPHGHQFYQAILKGLFSLDLSSAGTFSYRNKTGFKNLDDNRIEEAKNSKLEDLNNDKSFRLPLDKRQERIATLLRGLGVLYGGAKQSVHYTDVTPKIFIGMVTRGGNNPLQYIIGADERGLPKVHEEALKEVFNVWDDQILSKLYVGWVQGFFDEQREFLIQVLNKVDHTYELNHPRNILNLIAEDITSSANGAWLT
ncbi:MAG: type I-B CRISPR-associated protein Cas7/Cst2/DevR [Spirochaetes bacterium]|nr:MAG: type I-B CRISPR-associated protein Cas7/Cst2/DevR [Spirochaetota bacterium]